MLPSASRRPQPPAAPCSSTCYNTVAFADTLSWQVKVMLAPRWPSTMSRDSPGGTIGDQEMKTRPQAQWVPLEKEGTPSSAPHVH